MTVVVDEEDAGHAVLTVRTDLGDLILDASDPFSERDGLRVHQARRIGWARVGCSEWSRIAGRNG
jgi:Bacterial transglutaminase-like cysteine proteinase BTLCP